MTFEEAQRELTRIDHELNETYAGKTVEIVSNYNGQPHGFSRKPLTGKRFKIRYVIADHSGVAVFVEGQTLALRADEIRVVNESKAE